MRTATRRRAAIVGALLAASPLALAHPPRHDRHTHHHNDPHPTTTTSGEPRFTTSRDGADLELPLEEDAFLFVVFGDRTGGPDIGVEVLKDAVRDTNLIEPDLVMTVGDLIQGYNRTDGWMEQMREYKGIMDELLCPWFPVAGNHDVYWRPTDDPEKPEGEHEASYEMHFGPLWYAFEHKNCWFIALYSDEGNPDTGEKNFGKPACQNMSPEQFAWLAGTLKKAEDADHVFLFVHHPRWLGNNYGGDWGRVHQLLVTAGNVTAVFAGHIHRMRSDPRDGIEYVTLATVGAHQGGHVPSAGYLHHFNTVTVRKDQVALASIPVGEVMDVRDITGQVSDDCLALSRLRPTFSEPVGLESDGTVSGSIAVKVQNPVGAPIHLTLTPGCADSRWSFTPDHNHAHLGPGEAHEFVFHAHRIAGFDAALRLPAFSLESEYLTRSRRYPIPAVEAPVPVVADIAQPARPQRDQALSVSGVGDVVVVASDQIDVPDGPLTIECWAEARTFSSRTGLIAKTENSDYGIFVSDGRPEFIIFIGDSYLTAAADGPMLETGTWHHIAGVYDGEEARLYVDGRLVSAAERRGERRTNLQPFNVGADVDRRGEPTSPFDGLIDGVRISTVARYTGGAFVPATRHVSDADTALLLNMDGAVGPWLFDESGHAAHPLVPGGAPTITPR